MRRSFESLCENSFKIKPYEIKVVFLAFMYLFCLMASYYIMRPLRDALASEIASEDLKFLWTATFTVSLIAALVFGWLVTNFKLSKFLPFVYIFFIFNILGFYILMRYYPLDGDASVYVPIVKTWPIVFSDTPVSTVVACIYYVWLSVFNMFVVSIFWSFLADYFSKEQSKRTFGFIAGGGSLGAALAPLITAAMVSSIGVDNLLLIAAMILAFSLLALKGLIDQASSAHNSITPDLALENIGGSAWSGFRNIFKDPFVFGIAIFIVLYTFISTIFYVAQIDLVRAAFETREARYAVNAIVDGIVNCLAIFTQIFITSRIVGVWGIKILLSCIPFFMIFAFFLISLFPVLFMILFLQIVRRAGNYALTRPGREMIWTVVKRQDKYKTKNVIDTSVYRGADLVNIWIENGLRSTGMGLSQIALVGSTVAALWFTVAFWLGRRAESGTVTLDK